MVTLDEVKQNLKRITDTFYYTKSEVLNKLDEKANTNHTHNQYLTQHQSLANYYTKSEVDSALGNVDLSNYYSKSEIDTLISNIDLSDYYDKTEVDDLIEAIDLSGFATISEVDTKVTLVQVLQLLIDYGLVRTADTVNSVILAGDKSVLSYVDEDILTLSATVYDEHNAVVPNKRVVFYKDDTVLDTVYTDANGVATYEYHSAGVGDVSFEASVGSLLSERYEVQDCRYYWDMTSNAKASDWILPSTANPRYSSNGLKLGETSSYSRCYLDIPFSTPSAIECDLMDYSNSNAPCPSIDIADADSPSTSYYGSWFCGKYSNTIGTYLRCGSADPIYLEGNGTKGATYRFEVTTTTIALYKNDVQIGTTVNCSNPSQFKLRIDIGGNRMAELKNFKIKPL